MNAVKTFIDTNVLIYAFTADEPAKQQTALKYLNNCLPVISTQVVKEFSNVLLKKTNISLQAIQETINEIIDVAEVVNEEIGLVFSAFGIYKQYKFSFYDSLIVATAIKSRCQALLSEDMQDGQIIDKKLKVVNPFKF
ncbi:MAG: PIN domain-containing protein [Synergistaceae bacterium]|nr:PIN domain-containing protein [Synergistaceae bacterium]